jgi:hypothetical protein
LYPLPLFFSSSFAPWSLILCMLELQTLNLTSPYHISHFLYFASLYYILNKFFRYFFQFANSFFICYQHAYSLTCSLSIWVSVLKLVFLKFKILNLFFIPCLCFVVKYSLTRLYSVPYMALIILYQLMSHSWSEFDQNLILLEVTEVLNTPLNEIYWWFSFEVDYFSW